MPNETGKKTCFVVMGFGKKTDYQSSPQRELDLDKTFENIIQPAVIDCGLECIRADKIIHSTVIDKPMYENLLNADLVVADLSTSNANAIYELGVRHALRPHTTIVMAENSFSFPFDINRISIIKYKHLGEDIGVSEANRVKKILMEKITKLVVDTEVDSPVFLFLPKLAKADEQRFPGSLAKTRAVVLELAAAEPAPGGERTSEVSFADLTAKLREEMRKVIEKARTQVGTPADWLPIIDLLKQAQTMQPNDPYIVQQLALATYKSERPDRKSALNSAKEILSILGPATSSDAETVGLWGAIHKRLWDLGKDIADLNQAIRAYARGYLLKDDYYNGINYAFLLNVRAAISTGDDAIADRVQAKRFRAEVLGICERLLADKERPLSGEGLFWVNATRVEAKVGLAAPDADALLATVQGTAPEPWMAKAMVEQIDRLRALL